MQYDTTPLRLYYNNSSALVNLTHLLWIRVRVRVRVRVRKLPPLSIRKEITIFFLKATDWLGG